MKPMPCRYCGERIRLRRVLADPSKMTHKWVPHNMDSSYHFCDRTKRNDQPLKDEVDQ